MTSDCVSITKTLAKGVKLITGIKKYIKSKGQYKVSQKNSYILLHSNDCETPYIGIYIDLLSIGFNLLSVL